MADGRIVADVGKERKKQFKSKLSLVDVSMTDWLKKVIDKFLKESEVKE